ncbi:MAG: penicillin-binding transpeptidase domain-containing protein [Fuerstiella sp.]
MSMRNQPFHPDLHHSDSRDESLIDPPSGFRFGLLATIFFLVTIVILGRTAWVQGVLTDRYLAALNTTVIDEEILPARDGRILTESSVVLASDVDQYAVQVHYRWLQNPIDPAWLRRELRRRLSRTERDDPILVQAAEAALIEQRQQMWTRLAQTVGLSMQEFTQRQQAIQERVERIADSVNRRRQQPRVEETVDESDGLLMRLAAALRSELTTSPHRRLSERIVVREQEDFHQIIADVPLDVTAGIHERPNLFPGVQVVVQHRRTYPQGRVAAHVVGARTTAKQEETGNDDAGALDRTGRYGRFGVERSYDHQLRSVPGVRRIVRNRRMEVVSSEIQRKPVSGRDVVLTLDFTLQQHAETLLAEALTDVPQKLLPLPEADDAPQPVPTGGSIVVMDVSTGRLLVAASAPGFDLSLFTGSSAADWQAVNGDQRHPFVSRVTSMSLPPGSVIKPFTAAAALEARVIDPDSPFYCQGFLDNPEQHRCLVYRLYGSGHGDLNMSRAIAQSCNVYFFAAARQMGFERLRPWFDHFGFGRPTGIDLPFEKGGHVPGSSVRPSDSTRMDREALGLSIGQSRLTVTPIQMVRAMAAVANGGWLVTPHVVSPDGAAHTTSDVDDRPRGLVRRRITGLSEGLLQPIREGLRAVVQQPYGTGYQTVRLEEVSIAGKTGTAETGEGQADHAWFAGYVPADQPRFAFAVVLEHGGSGSRAAGPIAREMVRALLQSGRL